MNPGGQNGSMNTRLALGSCALAALVLTSSLYAQAGNAGINEANTKARSYCQSGTNLM